MNPAMNDKPSIPLSPSGNLAGGGMGLFISEEEAENAPAMQVVGRWCDAPLHPVNLLFYERAVSLQKLLDRQNIAVNDGADEVVAGSGDIPVTHEIWTLDVLFVRGHEGMTMAEVSPEVKHKAMDAGMVVLNGRILKNRYCVHETPSQPLRA